MKHYILLVKGNETAVINAARERLPEDSTLTFKGYREKDNTSTCNVLVPEDSLTIMNWFVETPEIIPGKGYPNGTLLFYNEVE